LVSFGIIFTLSLILVFGTVFSSSRSVFAVDMGGTMDMPPPEDAPATTDALTAGGGSDNDDDDDDNDDDSRGSGDNDDDNDNDKDKDIDKDNEPASKDAPVTTDTLTAKKIECPPGQEVTLFSTTCEPAGADSATSAATVCPTSPIPTSYSIPDELSVTNVVWGFSEAETEQRGMQNSLLHRVQGSTGESESVDPTNCPPLSNHPLPSVLPFRGDEPRLINFYAMPVPDPDAVIRIDKTGAGSTFTFADGTIRTSAQGPNPEFPGETIDKTIITPGPRTPLDGLQVDRVEQTSHISKHGNPLGAFIDIKYKDGAKINYPDTTSPSPVSYDDGKGNGRSIIVDELTGDTRVVKTDGSVIVYPKAGTGNTYTVYPRAADGTQVTVTMTSEGKPILIVRDAEGNIIPPKE
jgi:hypothetical protein